MTVVKTDSQQAALAALVEFDPDDDAEANAERLCRRSRRSAPARSPRRRATMPRAGFVRGDSVGFAGDEIVAWGGAGSTLLETVAALADGAEIVTVIEGAEAPIPLDELDLELPDGAELELHRGGHAQLLVADRGPVSDVPKPVLWHIPVSHYSEKARWALACKGIEHERRAPPPGRPHGGRAVAHPRRARRPSRCCSSTAQRSATRPRSSRRSSEHPARAARCIRPTRPSAGGRWSSRSSSTRSSARTIRLLAWHEMRADRERMEDFVERRCCPAPLRGFGPARRPAAALRLGLRSAPLPGRRRGGGRGCARRGRRGARPARVRARAAGGELPGRRRASRSPT